MGTYAIDPQTFSIGVLLLRVVIGLVMTGVGAGLTGAGLTDSGAGVGAAIREP